MSKEIAEKYKELEKLAKKYKKKKKEKPKEETQGQRVEYIEGGAETLKEVGFVVEKHFPEMWEAVRVGLSTFATLLLKDNVNPVGVNFEGAPSSTKTTILSFFYNSPVSFKTDNFTPKAFVSHCNSVKEEELEKIDLLPKIKYKTIIVPELAPIFGKRSDDLIENLSILIRIFDGEGYENDTGARGHRGYQGDYLFAWLGGTTPLSNKVWKAMGKLGSRFLFYAIDEKNKSKEELLDVMDVNNSFREKVKECRKVVNEFINNLFYKHKGARNINWDGSKESKEIIGQIIDTVELMRRLRAPLQIWSEKGENDEMVYSYSTSIIEEPERAIAQLYNLARGHAIINDRDHLEQEDIDLIKKVALSSMPFDRRKLLQALIKHGGIIDSKTLEKELSCGSDRTARRTMEILKVLGIVNDVSHLVEQDSKGRHVKKIELKEKFKWVLDISHNEENLSKTNFGQKNDLVGNRLTIEQGIQVRDTEEKPRELSAKSSGWEIAKEEIKIEVDKNA